MIASTRPEPATIHIVDDDASLRESLEDLMHSVGLPAVSYTHLDVYKRQGHPGQRVKIGLLQRAALVPVDQDAAGHRGEVGARFVQDRWQAGIEDAREGVVGKVGRVADIAEPAAQPMLQPGMVVAVQGVDLLPRIAVVSLHGRLPGAEVAA